MFSKRQSLGVRKFYSRDYFVTFASQLEQAGFATITIKLPINKVPLSESTISITELLNRDRNYPSLILEAFNTERNESIKVLFVNINSNAVFNDDTFPNGQSEPPQLYIQSPDPARLYSLFGYYNEYLTKDVKSKTWASWLSGGIFSIVLLLLELVAFVSKGKGLLMFRFEWHISVDLLAMAIAAIISYKFYSEPTGLWIKPKRPLKIFYLLNMAIRGELKDNPIVTLIVTVIGGLIVMLIGKLIGLL